MPLNQVFYKVYRLFIKGTQTPSRSVEFFNTYAEAEVRFYQIIAADIANPEITYHECFVRDNYGVTPNGLDKVFDRRDFSEPKQVTAPAETPASEPATPGE